MKILISEEEKSRILGMHQNATSRHYLTEDNTKDDASLNYIVNAVAKIMNSQIDKKIQENPEFPATKITVKRTTNSENVFYCWKYDTKSIACDGSINSNSLMASNGPSVVGYSIKAAFDASKNPDFPNKLRPLPQPGLIATVDKWVSSYSPNPTTPK